MHFEQIEVGNMQNFSYLVGDSKECCIIDPGWDSEKLIGKAKGAGLEINKILLTHTHFDHINDVEKLSNETKAEVYVHSLEADIIRKINGGIKVVEFEDDDEILVGELILKVIHTPGHSRGSSCFLVEDKLITGDTLFVGSIGRTDFEESNQEDMKKSLEKLKLLNDDLEVWPGHDYGRDKSSTIKFEKENNPFLVG
tara:strand:+ start:4650 stop:5240 length:591 start_codon:yes stop_codon:yes gene_type:complete